MLQAKTIGTDNIVCTSDCLAEMMFRLSHSRINPEKPVLLTQEGQYIGIASFGIETTDGRETYFVFPKGARKFVKLFTDLNDLN